MKKIISNEGLLYGHYEATFLTEAINERVSNRLEYYYNSCSRNGDVTAAGVLSYDLFDGVVTAITLTYAINDPTPQRLRDFRATCDSFFELKGFVIDNDKDHPNVFFHATDMFDMAMLIHALEYLSVSVESIFKVVDGEYRRYLKHIDDDDDLDDDDSLDDDDDDAPLTWDVDSVGYSDDGKTLKTCNIKFTKTHYDVPDGVEVIEDFAFLPCRHFLELSIPRSVKLIGDYIFGNGGFIIVRD